MNKFSILLAGLVLGFNASAATADEVWVAPDFYVAKSRLKELSQGHSAKRPSKTVTDPASCADRIAGLMCVAEPRTEGQTQEQRTCLPGSEVYARPFLEVFSSLTPTFQQMFCSIDKIFVETQLGATGYAGVGPEGQVYIGIRQTVLDTGLGWAKWATWKEQLAFGGLESSYEGTPGLPFFVVSPVEGVNDFLYQFLVHEFGHQFDIANNVNQLEEGCDNEDSSCRFRRGTWGALSWATVAKPLPENDFETRPGLCYYGCTQPTSVSSARDIYFGVHKSNFINGYAATNAWDDFADGLAYYAVSKYLKQTVSMDDGQGARYDLTGKLSSERYRKKLEYIETFLGRTDIVYP